MCDVMLETDCPGSAFDDKHKCIDPISTFPTEFNDFGCELAHHRIYLGLVETGIPETRGVDDIDIEYRTILLCGCAGTTCKVISHWEELMIEETVAG